MLVHSKEVFDEELFRLSLKLISETGHFEAIDADKDVDYRVDEDRARVDITIRLKIRTLTVGATRSAKS
jgi:hypothetical protein